jgi:alkylhydroperoxidase/carboxymuconolactone decarboxylase family protein YurZ
LLPLLKKYGLGDSIIPKKYREMMALAEAAAMKCPYFQTFHREVCCKSELGVTKEISK